MGDDEDEDDEDQDEEDEDEDEEDGDEDDEEEDEDDDDEDDEDEEEKDLIQTTEDDNIDDDGDDTRMQGPSQNFEWSDFAVQSTATARDNDSDEDDEDAVDEHDNDADESKSHSARKKAAKRKRQEDDTREREEALVRDEVVPETADDFERLLVASPNSSYLWTKYMNFQLELSEVERARAVGERALQTIHFREEQEKRNIWLALMQLEHKYGDDSSLAEVFQRALQQNEPKKVHFLLLGIYQRAQEKEQEGKLLKSMVQRYKAARKVWLAYETYLLREGDEQTASQTLQRSLKSLPKHKHVRAIVQYGNAEYEHGSNERARTIMEGVLANYPKRADLWHLYIDKEVKHGDTDSARQLMDRAVCLKFSSRNIKSFFKKYLKFEEQHGDATSAEAVKQKAREYVAATASATS